MNVEPLFGVLAFLSFAASVVAAVMAIDMFALSRTGEFGPAWRVLIIASVMFALVQALRIASFFDWRALQRYGLSQIAELMFALSLAYAIYLQRHAFSSGSELRRDKKTLDETAPTAPDDEDDETQADPEESEDKEDNDTLPSDASSRSWPRLK
jgi:hypothetical protein